MMCRMGCGACCTAPSISSPIPGMPEGKPAGVPCVHLSVENRCQIFGDPSRPAVCSEFKASEDVCGDNRDEAMTQLIWLENMSS